jgi:hypothetical protein
MSQSMLHESRSSRTSEYRGFGPINWDELYLTPSHPGSKQRQFHS